MSTPLAWRKDGYAEKVSSLMKEMGCKKGFDPMPPSQHAWPTKRPGTDPLFRLWSWMCDKTIRRGHRWPYAVNTNGRPLRIEDAAHDLEMDAGNVRRAWREGEVVGLWHRGEGRNVERMYLNGEVVPISEEPYNSENEGEQKENSTCLYKPLPPYILKQIKDWPENRVTVLQKRYTALVKFRDQVQADLIAASRVIFDADEDNMWRDLGIKKIRESQPPKNGKGEEATARRERVQLILPEIQNFVQTSSKSVQGEAGEFEQTSPETANPPETEQIRTNGAAAPEALSRGFIYPEKIHSGGRASSIKDREEEKPPARPLENRVANFLKALPVPTVLDKPMLVQITNSLSEEVLDQFESACKEAKGIRKWAGYLAIAKQVAARGAVKTMVASANGESPAAKAYRESMERRQPKPCPTN